MKGRVGVYRQYSAINVLSARHVFGQYPAVPDAIVSFRAEFLSRSSPHLYTPVEATHLHSLRRIHHAAKRILTARIKTQAERLATIFFLILVKNL